MTPCISNEIKLWWHNLIRFHRRGSYKTKGECHTIFCFDCNYGKDDISVQVKALFDRKAKNV